MSIESNQRPRWLRLAGLRLPAGARHSLGVKFGFGKTGGIIDGIVKEGLLGHCRNVAE